MSKRRKWPPWATKSTCSHDKGGQRSDLLLGQYSVRESSHVIETCWVKAVKLAVNDRNRCDFFYTKWGNFFDWPQLIFNFTDSVQFKLGSLHAYSATLFYSVQRGEHLDSRWLLHLFRRATRPSVFVGRMSCRLVHDSLCISHQAHGERQGLGVCTSCFIYKAMIFVFPYADLRRLRERGMEAKGKTAKETRHKETCERCKQKRHKKRGQKDWWNQGKAQKTEKG